MRSLIESKFRYGAFFTSFDREGSFNDPNFASHILGAIQWASAN